MSCRSGLTRVTSVFASGAFPGAAVGADAGLLQPAAPASSRTTVARGPRSHRWPPRTAAFRQGDRIIHLEPWVAWIIFSDSLGVPRGPSAPSWPLGEAFPAWSKFGLSGSSGSSEAERVLT